jgi:hypothetical protein
MENKSKALILCQTRKNDGIRNDLTERFERYGIQPICHDETSVDKNVKRVQSEIELADLIIVPADGEIPNEFIYELGCAKSKGKPALFINWDNIYGHLPDVLASQVRDIHDTKDPYITSLNSKIGLFVNSDQVAGKRCA